MQNRCKHCSIDAKISTAALLSLEQVETIVSLLRAEGTKSPPLYGRVMPGLAYEPMDHPEIVAIHKLLHDLNPKAGLVRTMSTNGHRIARGGSRMQIIRELQNNGVEQFQLSLHGVEDTHDRFVGRPGAYQGIMQAARHIASSGAKIRWIYFLTKANITEFSEMIERARDAAGGTIVTDIIDIWSPVGRAVKHSHLLVTAEDIEQLPPYIKSMQFLPRYLPESRWIERAVAGEMQRELDNFLEKVRMKGGVPDYSLHVTRDNVDNFGEILAQVRTDKTSTRTVTDKSRSTVPDVCWLASKYGDTNNTVLYRVPTMRQEWLRRWREDVRKKR